MTIKTVNELRVKGRERFGEIESGSTGMPSPIKLTGKQIDAVY